MENFYFQRSRPGGYYPTGQIKWVGRGGMERDAKMGVDFLFYQSRPTDRLDLILKIF